MLKNVLIVIICVVIGVGIGYVIFFYTPLFHHQKSLTIISPQVNTHSKKIIGFLPYWLLNTAKKDYSQYITDLTYFSLTVAGDGTILTTLDDQETEPGYYALTSGKADPFLESAKAKKLNLSLLVFMGDPDDIAQLIEEPEQSAQNLIGDVTPIMKEYGFTDLNLDIESVTGASEDDRKKFVQFVRTVYQEVKRQKLGTVTVEISPTDTIKKRLIDTQEVSKVSDYIVVMAYDYHYIGSMVSGAVAPLGGATTIAEFDTIVGIQQTAKIVPVEKIILGIPLYGYQWETIGNTARSATIPGTGRVISSQRAEEELVQCSECKIQQDKESVESYSIYLSDTGTYEQIFFPDQNSTKEKTRLALREGLGGIAVWALGYEGRSVMEPLQEYKSVITE